MAYDGTSRRDGSSAVIFVHFVAMMAVVICHCKCGSQIERYLLPIIGYWSVPWFFTVSGYFFVGSFERYGMLELFGKKVKSLVIPYVIWCMWGWLIAGCFGGFVFDFSLDRIFAFCGSSYPLYNRPLWYVRTLLVLVVLGSGCLMISKVFNGKTIRLFSYVSCLFFAFCLVGRLVPVGQISSVLYFLIGSVIYMARDNGWIGSIHISRGQRILFCALMALGFICTRGIWFYMGGESKMSSPISYWMLNVSSILQYSTIYLFVVIYEHRVATLNSLAKSSTFVYFFHAPLLWCTLKVLNPLTKCYDASIDGLYMVFALIYPLSCVFLYRVLSTKCPRLYGVISGGR